MENEEYNQPAWDSPVPRRRPNFLAWPALVALGWLIYELTAQPNLGAAIVCAKFGWEDLLAAFWLHRNDRNRPRGRACFWLYLASGLWKTAITATCAIFAFAFLVANQRQPNQAQPPGQPAWPPWIAGVALTACMGFGFCALTTWAAIWLALHYRIKLWLSSGVHRARRHNYWPPYELSRPQMNKAGRLLLTALVILLVPLSLIFCAALVVAFPRPLAVTMIVLLIAGVVPVTILFQRDILMRKIVARAPWECWSLVEAFDELPVESQQLSAD